MNFRIDGEQVVEPGKFEVRVGASSADLPLQKGFRLPGPLLKL